ncbi:MAG: hypothetical protein WCP04_11890 [Pseudomonadota bacterium]|jgi:hypothetical protein
MGCLDGLVRFLPSKEASAQKPYDSVQPIAHIAGAHARHPGPHSDLRHFVEERFRLASKALAAYKLRKMELGAIDFTDQENLAPETRRYPTVRETLAQALELLLVDEF